MVEYIKVLEQCGYQVEQSTKLPAEYLIIFQSGKPIGFLFQNGNISLLADMTKETEKLTALVAFFKEYKGLEQLPDNTYVLMRYMHAFLTATFSPDTRAEIFTGHLVDDSGAVREIVYADRLTAIRNFLISTEAIRLKDIETPKRKENVLDKGMRLIAEKYLSRQTQG